MTRDHPRAFRNDTDHLMGELLADPQLGLRFAHNAQHYRRVAAPVLEDLAAIGISVGSLGDLRTADAHYRAAVPILLKWLPRIADPQVRADLVRTLSMPKAGPLAVPVLLAEFRRTDIPQSESMRWAIANGLAILARDDVFDQLVALATDRQYGKAREMLVLALGNCRKSNAVDVLIRLLDDDQVVGHAVMAIRKLRANAARPHIEPLVNHPKQWVRLEAQKAIKAMDRAAH